MLQASIPMFPENNHLLSWIPRALGKEDDGPLSLSAGKQGSTTKFSDKMKSRPKNKGAA